MLDCNGSLGECLITLPGGPILSYSPLNAQFLFYKLLSCLYSCWELPWHWYWMAMDRCIVAAPCFSAPAAQEKDWALSEELYVYKYYIMLLTKSHKFPCIFRLKNAR